MAMIFFQFHGIPNVGCVFCGRTDASRSYGGNISYDTGDEPRNVRANRASLFSRLGSRGMRAWHECRQVHGDYILVDPDPAPPRAEAPVCEEADGMMTSTPGLGLMIKTADCQPVLLSDAAGRHIMALHVGWRGNRINFPATAVKKFCDQYQLDPAEISAVRGPSLGPGAAEFINFESEWGEGFRAFYDPQTGRMNLWALTRSQLEAAGVPAAQIHGIDICTWMNEDAWFSYRRQKSGGRQASFIWIIPEGGI